MTPIVIEPAVANDLPDILALQKLAFTREAERYNCFDMQPLVQTLEDIRQEFRCQTIFKAAAGGRIVGSARAFAKDGTCFIGKLAVHPAFQKQGIGTGLMRRIEESFTTVHRFELFTGSRSEDNIRLYRKLGYRSFGVRKVNDNLSFLLMEKRRVIEGSHEMDRKTDGNHGAGQ